MKNFENLCVKCMNDKGTQKRCPFCGYVDDNSKKNKINRKKLILQDKYVVGNKISDNAESICYIGYDIKNNSKVHIREFFPSEICVRTEDSKTVKPKESCSEKYENLKKDFLTYFRTVAKVRDIEAIMSVYDIFTEYGTAYIVSEVVDGITLSEFIKKSNQPLNWETTKMLFMPIISAFSRLSRAGVLHLAINPDCLIIGKNGKMYISNFSTQNLRKIGVFSNFEFNKGFTAPEQYVKNYKLTQVADIYGLTATMFFALVGFPPKDALERNSDERLLIPIRILKNIPPHVMSALSNGLKINVQVRTQSFEVLRDELTETSAKYLKEQETSLQKNDFKVKKKSKRNNLGWIFGTTLAFFVLLILGFIFYFSKNTFSKNKLSQTSNSYVQETSEIKESIIVPNFVGQVFENLQKENDWNDDYKILLSEKVFDDTFEAGKVISQVPQPEISVKKGSNIIVTVSKGSKFKALPKIDGLTLSQASSILTKNGFIPVQDSQFSSDIEQGKIIGYNGHKSDEKVEVGSQIRILVSKGKN